MANCPNCGGIMRYDIELAKLLCESCGSKFRPEELGNLNIADEQDMMDVTVFTCPNCGGEIYSTDRDATGNCSYCGSHVTFESRLSNEKRPKYIIPFSKTKQECIEAYFRHIHNCYFVSKELKKPKYVEGFRGIYMPYWVKQVEHTGDLDFYGNIEKLKDDFAITDTFRVKAHYEACYPRMYHDASSTFSDDISERIEPFAVKPEGKKDPFKPFYPGYLAGFYAEPVDIDPAGYDGYFDQIAEEASDDYLKKNSTLSAYKYQDEKKAPRAVFDKLPALSKAEEDRKLNARITGGRHITKQHCKEVDRLYDQEEAEFKRNLDALKLLHKDDPKPEKAEEKMYPYEKRSKESCLAMFPVWFLSYRKDDRVAYITMNGQTGRVSADLPIDFASFFKVAGVLSLVLCVLSYFILMQPKTVALFAACFSMITLVIYRHEMASMLEHSKMRNVHTARVNKPLEGVNLAASALGIMLFVSAAVHFTCYFFPGMEFLRGRFIYLVVAIGVTAIGSYECIETIKDYRILPHGERRFPSFLICLLSLFTATLVLILKPANDLFYYGVCALSLVGMTLSMLHLTSQFNKIATRPLPQFAHKGGDDRAR